MLQRTDILANATEFCRAPQADKKNNAKEDDSPEEMSLDRELGTFSKTAEDGDGNVGKTISLIYRRQTAHVNIWNKADICAVLLSNETSTAPFPRCLQNVN